MFSTDSKGIGIDTYAGKIHVEWDPQADPFGPVAVFHIVVQNKWTV